MRRIVIEANVEHNGCGSVAVILRVWEGLETKMNDLFEFLLTR
jgi:hypothetical protein